MQMRGGLGENEDGGLRLTTPRCLNLPNAFGEDKSRALCVRADVPMTASYFVTVPCQRSIRTVHLGILPLHFL
ncbi:hypothetical protein DdX_02146 [Ditylenchus destructor]|uniref:Uncharacterized protein n=1 Tax=Ditylenchus destructor TaxID=166010 RepID=A0AAD4NDS5_9BILA|nr:hypothetical protein DdX_02146 [Ditylenchus destructor]